MDFREATDQLCAAIIHEDVARALDVSVQSVRQTRMKCGVIGHRSSPNSWEQPPVKLAKERIDHLQ
jgi:hypothetical protein